MERRAGAMSCGECGTATPKGARFCPGCGARLADQPAQSGPQLSQQRGEHRQITVMFADIVGSTRLSAELDAEDLRELLQAYQRICAAEIESRGGMIASYMGDGVMAYFGYPRASEDAAIRAVDAGLGITREVTRLGERVLAESNIVLAARVALHTGRVLVSEIGSGDHRDRHGITGIVPNLAARLEGIAPDNGLVISAQTLALLGDAFDVETMGRHELKGIPEPVEVFRVTGRRLGGSSLGDRRRPLVARERELATLAAAWAKAASGAAVRAAVIAEPGTGKSALAATFIKDAGIEPGHVIEFAGAIDDRSSPFACLRQTISRHLHAAGASSEAEARVALARWLGDAAAANGKREAGHVATMLRLWRGELQDGADGRSTLFAAAAALVAAMPAPVLLLLEDAHWIDPSTLELLDRIVTAEGSGRLALVLTRPSGDRDWERSVDVTIALGRLSGDDCRELVEAVAGSPVEASLVRTIDAATDGLPLYVEEFTKALIESGYASHQRGVLRAVRLDATIETPASLLDLITSRLDMLEDAKALAQIAAVLGRSFEEAALVAVSTRPAEEVRSALGSLEAAGIMTRAERGRLTFSHALYQKAAYESLLRSARRTWHRRYLDWLEAEPERLAAVRPEIIAFHLDACGEPEAAAERYLEAGLAANRASASLEAAAQFRRAADLLGAAASADGAQRLRAQVLLAGALLSARGPGAPETRAAYDEALRLAEVTPECDWHLAAYWGWWRVSDTFAAMAARGRRLLEVSRRMQGAEFKLQAMHCAWANSFVMGELKASVEIAKDGLELYEEAGFDHLRTLYGGHDCKVCALGETGLAVWLLGAGDAAATYTARAVAHAEAIEHVGSLMHALDIAVMLDHYRRDGDALRRHAERLLTLGRRHDLEEYRAKGDIFLGWRDIDAGRPKAGLARVERGFRVMQEVGTPEDFPVYQCMRAEALQRLGEVDAALAALADGRAVIVEQGVAFWAAEIARLEANAEMGRRHPDEALARAKLEEATAIAQSQGALALELRAARTALAFAVKRGNADAARTALAVVLARFAADACGRDIDEARAALAPATAS